MSTEEKLGIRPVVLPQIKWHPTKAQGDRNGHQVRLIPLHRWAARATFPGPAEARSYHGVISEFENTANQASAHFVYPGSSVAGGLEVTQMVPMRFKAWTESFFNPVCVEIECADAIWLGHDAYGLAVTARMTAYLLHHFGLPPVWVHGADVLHGHGFCRHADLGAAGGGHTQCPTTDLHFFAVFAAMVTHEYHRGGFRQWEVR